MDWNKIDSTGWRIQKRREELNYSQQYVAEEVTKIVGRTTKRETVNQWESNSRNIKADSLRALCLVLKCRSDFLLCLVDDPTVSIEVIPICDYTHLSENTIIALHNLNDRTGIARTILEELIDPPDAGYDMSPIAMAAHNVIESALALRRYKISLDAAIEYMKKTGLPYRQENDPRFTRYDPETGSYRIDALTMAESLIDAASAEITKGTRTVLINLREDLVEKLGGHSEEEIRNRLYVSPWSETEDGRYGYTIEEE